MPDINRYAEWIVANQAKKGTEEFETVATAYRQLRGQGADISVTPAAPEEDTSLLGYIPETFKAIGAGGAGMIESALTGAAFLLPEEQEQAARARIAEIGGGVQEFLAPDEAYEGTYLDLMRGVGSTLPFLATGFLGAPGLVAGAAMGVGAGAGEAAQRATAAGATEEEISAAAGYGMIPGALEMLAPTRIISRARRALGANTEEVADALNNSFKSRLARVSEGKLGRVTRAAMEEAAQEASSEVLQNLIAQGVYDPDTGTFEGVGESAKIGGGVGGILQFFTDLIIPGQNRGGGRAEGDESVFEDEPAAEAAPKPSPLARQDSPTVLSADDLEGLGLDLDKATADKLFGLDLADPEQKTQARRILTNYRNNPAVQNNKPQTVSRIDSLLRSEIFQEPEEAILREREELPLEERIRVRPPAEVQPDLIDIAETEQAQEMLDDEELAQMQAEEDVRLASQEAAKAEVATVQQEMELGETDRRVAERRQQESVEKRKQVLQPILERGDITDVENLTRAFSAELGRQGFTDINPTQDELAAITRRSYELEQAAGEATTQAAEQAAGTAELEALIPERRETPAAPELTEQELQRAEKARLNREQMDRTGRGLEGQLEIPAIERPERAAARAAEPEAAPAAPGTVRLYRVEATPEQIAGAEISPWVKESPEFKQAMEAGGRWFTDDPAEADWYLKNEYPEGRVVAVDVPVDEAEKFRVSNIPEKEGGKNVEENPRAFSRRPEKEFFLPREMAGQAKPPHYPQLHLPNPKL
jgi:hypothetical protein